MSSDPAITVTVGAEPVISVTVDSPVTLLVSEVGIQGASGSGALVGAGLQIVGSEIRYDISSLTRG